MLLLVHIVYFLVESCEALFERPYSFDQVFMANILLVEVFLVTLLKLI